MNENEIAQIVVDASFHIHKETGPGLLESVYEIILADELEERGLSVVRQAPIEIVYHDRIINEGFRADLMVNEKVIIELKSVETIKDVHKKQLLTYLKLSGKRLGLLINFGDNLIKNGIKRIVNGL
ncbi:GxxExxY protein [Verrucomicrobia bacterium S94]|nr:GxxExxY protein [Verrucomicrobia bacterium S94]